MQAVLSCYKDFGFKILAKADYCDHTIFVFHVMQAIDMKMYLLKFYDIAAYNDTFQVLSFK